MKHFWLLTVDLNATSFFFFLKYLHDNNLKIHILRPIKQKYQRTHISRVAKSTQIITA